MAEPDVALDASAPAHGPGAVAPAEDRRLYVASQWQLMWWRFRGIASPWPAASSSSASTWWCWARTSSPTPTRTRPRRSAR